MRAHIAEFLTRLSQGARNTYFTQRVKMKREYLNFSIVLKLPCQAKFWAPIASYKPKLIAHSIGDANETAHANVRVNAC